MFEMMAQWKQDKFKSCLYLFYFLTVFTSFFGDAVISATAPGVGEIFPFRIFFLVTLCFYFVWVLKGNDPFWKNLTVVEKWCYIFIAVMLLYGIISLFRAIDVMFTFRKLFNLCFVLGFFFLILRFCRDRDTFRRTVVLSLAAVVILALMGVYEVFFGGIFSDKYDGVTYFSLFMTYFQFPVTTFANCNDYSSVLVFIAAVGLLALAVLHKNSLTAPQLWAIALGFPLLWFLVLASSARLCLLGLVILFGGFSVYFLCREPKKYWVLLIALGLILGIQFAHQYREIAPAFVEFFRIEMTEQNGTDPDKNDTSHRFEEQFYVIDDETGEMRLDSSKSGGARMQLVLHAVDCFAESKGMGVGLGNTEVLAEIRKVAANEDGYYSSIHCFLLRIVADYGIFILIPLCVLCYDFVRKAVQVFLSGKRRKDRTTMSFGLFFLCTVVIFPVVSTASSDAQNILAMWIYLAVLALLAAGYHLDGEDAVEKRRKA